MFGNYISKDDLDEIKKRIDDLAKQLNELSKEIYLHDYKITTLQRNIDNAFQHLMTAIEKVSGLETDN